MSYTLICVVIQLPIFVFEIIYNGVGCYKIVFSTIKVADCREKIKLVGNEKILSQYWTVYV